MNGEITGYKTKADMRTRYTVRFFNISAMRTWHFLFSMAFVMEQSIDVGLARVDNGIPPNAGQPL